MNKAFKEALDNGLVEPVMNFNGGPLIIEDISGKPIQYYQASEDGVKMLMGRFHSFGDMLRRHDTMKLTDELVTTAFATIMELQRRATSQHGLDPDQSLECIRETMTTIERLEQRRAMGMEIGQVYDVASIWFFSDQEDPGQVDNALNKRKIADWLRYNESTQLFFFFVSTPVGRFVPLRLLLEGPTLEYMKNVNQLELLDLTRLLLKSNSLGISNDTISTIELRKETLQNYSGLLEALSNLTTTS